MSNSKVSDKLKRSIVDTITTHDSMNGAIKLAKLNGVSPELVQRIIMEKQSLKSSMDEFSNKLLKGMNLGNNIIHLDKQWYGIRYVNEKGDTLIKFDLLNEKDLSVLRRDGRRERELSRVDLDTLLPGCIAEVPLEMYKSTVKNKAYEIVEGYGLVLDRTEEEDEKGIIVTNHVGRRYVQRKLGIGMNNEDEAEAYRREHLKEIEEAVLREYSEAELMWTGEDGCTYSFDEDNFMYVEGNGSIITLYEEDFGFDKDINRMITLQQVEVLKKAHESLQELEEEQKETEKSIAIELQDIEDSIAVLEAKIEHLMTSKNQLLANRDHASKATRVSRNQFNKEFNKLFKKWDS